MGAIFISYRREDTEGHAGRLFEDLVERFGRELVFIDVTGIEPGRDFRKVIDDKVASCGVLLAMIGSRWLDVKDDTGQRRIDDAGDFVRIETASALRRDIPVVPVLVHGAKMPTVEQLPPELADLAYRNAVELTHARWESDVQVLIDALARWVAPRGAADTPAPPPPAPARETPSAGAASTPRRGLGAALVAAAVVLVLAAVGWWLIRPVPDDPRSRDGERREIALLIAQATGEDLSARRSATARLIDRHAKSALAVQLALEQLSEANFQRLSKEGRVNVLTFLQESNPAVWSETMRTQGRLAVRRIRDRIASGTATLGPQVVDLLVKLGDKLGA